MGAQWPGILHGNLHALTAPSPHSNLFHFLLFLFLFLLTLSVYSPGSSGLEVFESILRPEIRLLEWRIGYSYAPSWHTRSVIHKPPCSTATFQTAFRMFDWPTTETSLWGTTYYSSNWMSCKVMKTTIISYSGDCQTLHRDASGRCGIFQNYFLCNLCVLYFQMATKVIGQKVIKLFWTKYFINGSVRCLFWPRGAVKNYWVTKGAVNRVLGTAVISK